MNLDLKHLDEKVNRALVARMRYYSKPCGLELEHIKFLEGNVKRAFDLRDAMRALLPVTDPALLIAIGKHCIAKALQAS